MITYFDTSSIVKWFFDEPYMDLARSIKDRATLAFTSLIAYPEVMSAMNRAWKDERCSQLEMEMVRDEFHAVWHQFKWIKINERLMELAGQLVFRHSLRGFDSVHLASAITLAEQGNGIQFFFSCFDKHLNSAAQKEGFHIHDI
ncbi:MAG: type II toxin-antitoxin system VapC family toxin [bacterium]